MPPGPLGSTRRGSCCAPSPPPCRSWRRTRSLPRRSLPSSWGRGRRRKRSRQWGLCGCGPATPWQHGGRRIPGAEASSDAWEPPALAHVVCCPPGAVLGLAYTCRPGGDEAARSVICFLNFNTPNQKTNIIFIQKQGVVYTRIFYDENSYLIKGLISYEFL